MEDTPPIEVHRQAVLEALADAMIHNTRPRCKILLFKFVLRKGENSQDVRPRNIEEFFPAQVKKDRAQRMYRGVAQDYR